MKWLGDLRDVVVVRLIVPVVSALVGTAVDAGLMDGLVGEAIIALLLALFG